MYDISLKPLSDNKFELLSDYTYKDITVPAGYKTNGADVPRIFWYFLPPFKPSNLPAIIVHDYLIDMGEIEKANKYFEELLIQIDNTRIHRIAIRLVKFYWKHKLIRRILNG